MPKTNDDRANDAEFVPFDTSVLSFARSRPGKVNRTVISIVEWLSGKITLLRIANRFEKSGRKYETTIWEKVAELLEIDLDCPPDQIARIPATGPVVLVANHPFGFVDGLVLANLVCKVRLDMKILTRSFFAGVPDIKDNMVAVAFPHDEDSQMRNIAVRKEVMEHLANGGVVILFPAGRVATARRFFGPAVEHPWNPFTAKMILKSKARVVPVFFPGQNGWLYQFVQHFSPTLRQALLMHEVVRKIGSRQSPTIGHPIEREEIDALTLNQTEFMAWLRARTLALNPDQSKT